MINVTKNAFKIVSEMLRNRIERRSKLIQKRYKNPAVKKIVKKKKNQNKENALAIEKLFLNLTCIILESFFCIFSFNLKKRD